MSRATVLVTGMSGTGKSTALAALGRRGHHVVDSDDPGWIIDSAVQDGTDGPEPMWELDRVGGLLDAHREGWLFVAGCVANQGALYGRFGAVVLLTAPLEVLLARVVDRANPFGKHSADRTRIAADQAEFEPVLRAGATHEISTTAMVVDVVTGLEQIGAAVAQ